MMNALTLSFFFLAPFVFQGVAANEESCANTQNAEKCGMQSDEVNDEVSLLQTKLEVEKGLHEQMSSEDADMASEDDAEAEEAQINKHHEALVSLMQQTLSGSVSPETSLIQAVKFLPTNKKDMRKFVKNWLKEATPGIIGQPGPDPPAQCPTDPEKTKDLRNEYGTDACCNVWRHAGHCKGPYENWMTANCAEACCDPTPISPGTTLIGHPGTSCDEACAAVAMKCDNYRLQSVDTEEEVIQVAGEAGASCNGTEKLGYPHSPSQCTTSWCKGICSYGDSWVKGNNYRGNCSYKGYWDKWSRFCPCKERSKAEAKAAAEYAATRTTILGKPGKTCDETCSTLKLLMNGTVTTTCRCRDDHACTSKGHKTSWCYIDSMDSCSDSVKGGGGPWSEESCSTKGSVAVCDDVRLQAVDSSEEVLELAGEAGIACNDTSSLSFAFSPSQYTGKSCGDGFCTGICTYGGGYPHSKARSCSSKEKDGLVHARLCPCMMSESLLSVSAKSKKDKKGL